jgi:hypothetical protein
MNIVHRWEKFIGLGCSHGTLIDPDARRAALQLKKRFNPKRIFHLGDWCDTAALRAGAKGTEDEGKPIGADIDEGIEFLEEMGVTDCTMGNHDERPYRFLKHHNAQTRELAAQLVYGTAKNPGGIEGEMKRLKIRWVNTWDIRNYIYAYGWKWMHGYMFGQQCARDHADAHGNVCFAHAHTPASQQGRRDDNPTGICVGTLTRIGNMDYAKTRRQTHAWGGGMVYGEGYGNKMGWIQLINNGQKKGEWRLPL